MVECRTWLNSNYATTSGESATTRHAPWKKSVKVMGKRCIGFSSGWTSQLACGPKKVNWRKRRISSGPTPLRAEFHEVDFRLLPWLRGWPTFYSTCQSPAVRIALHVLRLLFVPSVAFHVVETTFARGFESYVTTKKRIRYVSCSRRRPRFELGSNLGPNADKYRLKPYT